ncbi:uncharacterized protein LOC142356886, partial [Convolutriloba macropyga]|uniref:uncharacterized protein LOC142356886 n=1 Tax=Convolutriloba macropyga TaxID=536237 RepID=UPI003F51EC58
MGSNSVEGSSKANNTSDISKKSSKNTNRTGIKVNIPRPAAVVSALAFFMTLQSRDGSSSSSSSLWGGGGWLFAEAMAFREPEAIVNRFQVAIRSQSAEVCNWNFSKHRTSSLSRDDVYDQIMKDRT